MKKKKKKDLGSNFLKITAIQERLLRSITKYKYSNNASESSTTFFFFFFFAFSSIIFLV